MPIAAARTGVGSLPGVCCPAVMVRRVDRARAKGQVGSADCAASRDSSRVHRQRIWTVAVRRATLAGLSTGTVDEGTADFRSSQHAIRLPHHHHVGSRRW